MKSLLLATLTLVVLAVNQPAEAVDARAAQNVLRQDKCMTCHAVDRKKDGPSYKEVAEKYRGKADAEAALTKHITEPSMVEVDGQQEEHGTVSTTDPDVIRNVVQWIMSL
jgi:cytochrome c